MLFNLQQSRIFENPENVRSVRLGNIAKNAFSLQHVRKNPEKGNSSKRLAVLLTLPYLKKAGFSSPFPFSPLFFSFLFFWKEMCACVVSLGR